MMAVRIHLMLRNSFMVAFLQMARVRSAGVTLRIIHSPGDGDGEWSWGRGEDDK